MTDAIHLVVLIGLGAFALVLALAAAVDLRRRVRWWLVKREVARQYREWQRR